MNRGEEKRREGRGVFRRQTSQVSCHASNPRSAGDSERLHSGTGWEKQREREGGVKRGNRNNSKQTRREKDREGEALRDKQLFYFEGGKEARCEDQMTANTEREGESSDTSSLSLTQNPAEECQSLRASRERLQVFLCTGAGGGGDAFRLPGRQERKGQSGERSEARGRSGDGNEDAICVLLSWLSYSRRGEVFGDQTVLSQVGTCLTCLTCLCLWIGGFEYKIGPKGKFKWSFQV